MINLGVSFGPSGAMWALLYKTRGKAEDARSALLTARETNGVASITDDYGTTADLRGPDIHGVILEDLDLTGAAQIERSLQQARVQVNANRMAASDPVLKTAQMINGGGVVQQGGHPFMRGN